MATTWLLLKVDAFGYTAGTTVKADDTEGAVIHLLNSGLATKVANPGGTPPNLSGVTPGVAAGASAATAATVGAITDTAGQVTATAPGTGMAAGPLAVVTFTRPRTTTPRAILLSDRSAVSAGIYVSAKSATGFTIAARTAPTASQVFTVDYAVID